MERKFPLTMMCRNIVCNLPNEKKYRRLVLLLRGWLSQLTLPKMFLITFLEAAVAEADRLFYLHYQV